MYEALKLNSKQRTWIRLWHWKRWLHRVYALPQRAALMEITRYRWQVARAYSGCESRLVDTMFEALDLVEKNIRGS